MSDPPEGRQSRDLIPNKLRTYSTVALLVSIGLCAPGNRGHGPPWLWKVGEILFFLIFLAISAAGTILGFGLCARNFMRNNRLGTIGADAFFLCGAGVLAALVWVIVVVIIRAVKARSR